MKQDTKDVIIKVITEWTQYSVNLNWDANGNDMVHHFANIMRAMTFPTQMVIDSLREVANELEMDINVENENNFNEEEN